VQEFSDPLGGEFRTVLEQARLGMPLPRALDEMLKRMPEEDLPSWSLRSRSKVKLAAVWVKSSAASPKSSAPASASLNRFAR
jgi:Flp pilus assembly protein TadB